MRILLANLIVVASLLAASTTAPTSAPFDASTPKGALKVFSKALDTGDRAAILDCLSASSDQDRKLATATADLAAATAQLKSAATKAFGSTKARPLGVDPDAMTAAAARIDAATETITGVSATVRTTDNEGPPMSLVKEKGKWRLPVADLTKDVEAADVDKNLADVAAQVALMKTLADEIAAGKFSNATDARQALDQRIIQSATRNDSTTKPAVAPEH